MTKQISANDYLDLQKNTAACLISKRKLTKARDIDRYD